MTTSHVEVPGGRLLVVDEGSGPPDPPAIADIDVRLWVDGRMAETPLLLTTR